MIPTQKVDLPVQPPFAFQVLGGLPPYGPSPEQFTAGSKRTHTEGLVVEFEPTGGTPWVANFQCGLTAYSNVVAHPNGQDLVIIAGGVGYVVRPQERKMIANFGGGVLGLWSIPVFNFLLFNDSGVAFSALGSEGWCWKTRRISWDGFEAIEIAEKTIYGRAWNAVVRCWEPFRIEIATGLVSGGAYNEAGQQRIARGKELILQGGAPLHPLIKRFIEGTIGIFAIALGALSVYLIVDGARTGELTWGRIRDYWGLAYFLLALIGIVVVVGVRLVFPSLAPQQRLLSPSAITAFFVVYLTTALVMFFKTGVVPLGPVMLVVGAIGGFAIHKWFS
jgi:hypothetical protein